MRVAVIGCGRVGSALALALASRSGRGDVGLAGVCSRGGARARALVRRCGAGRVFTSPEEAASAADVLLLCVPDGALAKVAAKVASARRLRGKIILHTSGALDLAPLAQLAVRGASVGSLHPLAAFPTARSARAADLFSRSIGFTAAGSGRAAAAARAIVRSLGGFLLPAPASRAAYHLAASMMANHVTVLAAVALEILESRAGMANGRSRRAFVTLLRTAADRIEAEGAENALTGPAARGDLVTLRRHLKALSRERRELREIYVVMSREAIRTARRRGDLGASLAAAALRALRPPRSAR